MKALISGQAATAVIIDNKRFYSTNIDDVDSFVERQDWEMPLLFGEVDDLQEVETVSKSEAVSLLEMAWKKDRSLHLFLILLDNGEDGETRLSAAECLDDFFQDNRVREYIENRLYSKAVTSPGDLSSAIQICKSNGLSHIEAFCYSLNNDQEEIHKRSIAWEELPLTLFGNAEEKESFRFDAIRFGAYRMFVTMRGKKNFAIVQLLTHPFFRGNSKARSIFQAWASPFQESATNIEFERGPHSKKFSKTKPRINHIKKPGSSRPAFLQAEKQRDFIKDLLAQGSSNLVMRYTKELIENQRKVSDPIHIAKSLCDLAQYSKKIGSPELQLEFAKLAIQEVPYDAWSHSTAGDAYRALTDFQNATNEYHETGVLGDEKVAAIGRAEILKDLGQFENALEILDKCIESYPYDEIALNARASALADFGNLTKAFEAYNEILERNALLPNVVTLCGHAQVLREMGNLEEALDETEQILIMFPDDHVPNHMKAEILRETGRLDDSKALLENLITKFPLDIEMKISHAKVLRDMESYPEALAEYETIITSYQLITSGYIGKADILKKLGRTAEAKTMYDYIINNFPRQSYPARNGKAAILVAEANYFEALKLLTSNLPSSFAEWISYHIRGMAHMRSGEFSVAEAIFEHGINETPWARQRAYFKTALASLFIKQGKYPESIKLLTNLKNISIEPIARVITMHAFGKMGNSQGINQAFDNSKNTYSPIVISLRDTLAARYINNVLDISEEKFDDQILRQECDALLLVA